MYENTSRELRLILTNKCNYKCTFCHGEGIEGIEKELLDSNDYKFLYEVGKSNFGFKTITLSGGEPLIRNDISDIAKKLYDSGANITIVTNGSLLNKHENLHNYIGKYNLSIHSLNNETYNNLVGRDSLNEVIDNLYTFRKTDKHTEIRLNVALIEGVNNSLDNIKDYISLCKNVNASIKYMELFPKNTKGFVPLQNLKNNLLSLGFKSRNENSRNEKLELDGLEFHLSKIFCSAAEDTLSAKNYCENNNDLFITPNAKIKPCRVSSDEIDLLEVIKSKDVSGTVSKINESLNRLGHNCPLI